jgi:hypothetical protein
MAPTPAVLAAYASTCRELAAVVAAWQRLSTTELGAFNTVLTGRGRAALTAPTSSLRAPGCS